MPEIKGWCPGALAPMESGDGLLMRAKIVGCRLTLAQAREIAAIAEDLGNGLIDLSQRAQLQMRGFSEANVAFAQERLAAIGLLAPDASTEAVTNVMASPLPCEGVDANDHAVRLGAAIVQDEKLRALPGKFLFLVDGGGALGLSRSEADIRLELGDAKAALALDDARGVGFVCKLDDAIAAALALAHAFIRLRADRPFELRRMRALVAAIGAPRIFAEAGLIPSPYKFVYSNGASEDFLGSRVIDGVCFAGVGAPYGRMNAKDLAALAKACEHEGGSELRLTPWRAMLAPVPSREAAARIEESARRLDFICDDNESRLAIVACPGAPECPQALGPTRASLGRLAPYARRGASGDVGLHVSGCAKGCAKPSATAITLVASGAGFDVIVNGRASDLAVAKDLPLEEIVALLAGNSLEEAVCRA